MTTTLPGVAKPNPIDEAKDLQSMLVGYAKQETVEPLKSLGSYVGFGLAGAVLVFLGVLFVGVGVLRLLQSETGSAFDGVSFASLVPYLGSMAAMGLIVGLIFRAMSKATQAVR